MLRINKNNSSTVNRHLISCSEMDIASSTKLFRYDTEANSEERTEIELELDWKGVDIQSHLFLDQSSSVALQHRQLHNSVEHRSL